MAVEEIKATKAKNPACGKPGIIVIIIVYAQL